MLRKLLSSSVAILLYDAISGTGASVGASVAGAAVAGAAVGAAAAAV